MSEKKNFKSAVRCLNCFTRFAPSEGAATACCPKCGIEWRLFWLSPSFVKIRGPVWSKFKEHYSEADG